MNLYSYRGQEPKELPFRHRLDSGETLTSLDELDIDTLNNLGFIGPISRPVINEKIQKLEWNGTEYVISDLTEDEIKNIELLDKSRKRDNLKYDLFKEKFLESNYYKKISAESKNSIPTIFVLSQFMDELNDKIIKGEKNTDIQPYFTNLFYVLNPDQDDLNEIQLILEESNLDSVHFIPDENMLSSGFYDIDSNSILLNKPFDSWVFEDGRWIPPLPYPSDGNFYSWDESLKDWKKIA